MTKKEVEAARRMRDYWKARAQAAEDERDRAYSQLLTERVKNTIAVNRLLDAIAALRETIK